MFQSTGIGTLDRATADVQDADVFSDLLFGHLPRADQRQWARAYLRGLLFTPGRKSMRRLAESVSSSPTAWYSLQQFVSGSSWKWEPSRTELARWVERRASVRAWTLAFAVSPKRGGRSACVHRRFVPSSGRTVNCQLGTALFLSCPGANLPVDWRLYMPPEWGGDEALRRGARIPEDMAPQPLWKDSLDLVENMLAITSGPPAPVVADLSDTDDVGPAVARLESMGCGFVVAVRPGTKVVAERRPDVQRLPPARLRETVHTAGELLGSRRDRHDYTATVMGPEGVFRHVPVLSALFRLSGRRHGTDRVYRLFAQPGPESRSTAPLWMTNLTHRRLDELLELALLHTSAMNTVNCMDDRLELLDFAGRSFPGWHHHMTLVSAAYAYARLAQPGELPALPVRGVHEYARTGV
ncbi:IS701 family transposase [Streptomyces radiopugnans]|uniref:IS701 family transposase n=1 Tax=Streptomyces radiopugnans TaxID=403935 RepID=UPI003F1B1FEA